MSDKRAVKRRMTFLGLPINIEIDRGDVKKGIDENGQQWEREYSIPYGEINRTRAPTDGDPVDVYMGPFEADNAMVYVVHQLKRDRMYDEDKVMLGFLTPDAAADAYRAHGPSWGFGSMDMMTWDQFVHGYLAANRAYEHLNGPMTTGARAALGNERYGL